MRKTFLSCLSFLALLLPALTGRTQTRTCATLEVLENNIQKAPALQQRFASRKADLRNKTAGNGLKGRRLQAVATSIPVVFHIVLQNPSLVTDAQLLAQLDTLNKAFGGTNADSVKLPSYFQHLFGHSNIRFCLARRTPDDEPSGGIVRYTTTRSSFTTNEGVKHASGGGAAAWNTAQYLNIWICRLSNSVLGYATFPESSTADEQGIVIDYTTLPGGAAPGYNKGKTLVHETGHYFDLLHIWGDDGTACTGSDEIDDTPGQAGETTGCPSGLRTDRCTSTAPGILYQNYMDYTSDDCMVLFTHDQVARMETSLAAYRSSLLVSDGCVPVVQYALDGLLQPVSEPYTRLCAPSFTPRAVLKNKGTQTLTSYSVAFQLDNGTPQATTFTQTLSYNSSATVSLPGITIPEGEHLLKIFITQVNGSADENLSNDTLVQRLMYYPTVTAVSESFEGTVFPPRGWDTLNADGSYAWQRTTDAARTGTASVVLRNFDYGQNGPRDYLRLPLADLSGLDSAYLTFQVAAAVKPLSAGSLWDTLQVLASTDCGQTYTSLYKKWGAALATAQTSAAFVPTGSQWRKDSVNLTGYIPYGTVLLAFVNTTEAGNNLYLDDVQVSRVTVNPNLKQEGFLVTPNPTSGTINIDFYPPPANLKGMVLYNSSGQAIARRAVSQTAGSHYQFDLSGQAPGIYMLKVLFADKIIVRKVVRL
ncbi:M43 family zinc metalloprotease [Paraflavisolibacter sp. H34]|uniref:M43 family zinc metalloprotease n=1 Tax=Huijunlia imazamoxiresistens TaxID=3127457 RepID=UPI00301A448E